MYFPNSYLLEVIAGKLPGYLFLLLAFHLLPSLKTQGQGGFTGEVDRALGSNQELVNGIQFSNQYIRSEGQPYWLDGTFRKGSVCINDRWMEDLKLRYNLYTQKLELEYLTPAGLMNQIITVPESISAFVLDGQLFERLQMDEGDPAYYQVFSSGGVDCYIGLRKKLIGSESTGSRFGDIEREYWIVGPESRIWFRDRKSYLAAFPSEMKPEYKKLLKQLDFHFQRASIEEISEMLGKSILLLNERGKP